MNSKEGALSSGGAEDASESDSVVKNGVSSAIIKAGESDLTGMKRAAAKKLIERYYYQLTDGCGNPTCSNADCSSSGKVTLTPDEAAGQALKLFIRKAKLCEPNPAKMAKLPPLSPSTSESVAVTMDQDMSPSGSLWSGDRLSSMNPIAMEVPSTSRNFDDVLACSGEPLMKCTGKETSEFLTEEMLLEIIDICKATSSYAPLIRTIGKIYSSADSLNSSFPKLENSLEDHKNLTKEDLRSMEVDQDKDLDCKELHYNPSLASPVTLRPDDVTVDIDSVRKAYAALFAIPGAPFQGALLNALLILFENAELELRYHTPYSQDPNYLNMFVIVMEIPATQLSEFVEMALPVYCKATSNLPAAAQAKLARVWSRYSRDRLKEMIDLYHQLITDRVINGQYSSVYCIHDDDIVTCATKVMKILLYASIVGGKLDHESVIAQENEQNEVEENIQDILEGDVVRESKEPKPQKEDVLAQQLGVRILDCRQPLVSFEDFYNEPLSDIIEMHKDIVNYKDGDVSRFSFMNYGFILTPAARAMGLYYDNRIRMFSERRQSFLQSYLQGAPSNPYLKLKVRRDHIIDDALVELEMVAMENPKDLKKQLVVEFEGEQGIDEGGVSKEFFQLVVEEIFNPDFAMFSFNTETQTYWFNPTSFESDAQFSLIGIVLGLAIYNNIILDVHFPMVVYRKLLGKKGTFEDLIDWDPTLARGLQELLDYENDDMEEVFAQTFRIGYTDVFGTYLTCNLKENGDKIPVAQGNKQEFVDIYADFLLNKSVEKQFRAFRRGFQMVTEESPLKLLFRPEDVELLVSGSQVFDFSALEEATEYDNGYSPESSVIRQFWEVVHEFSVDQKRKLLQFTTGSDRVPVGGLSKLKLIISRNGSDSDRLPTAHTCFNVLLLPEYCSKEKLKERLLKAITYSKGFGML